MIKKRDKNNLYIIIAVVCLLISCLGMIFIDKTTSSLVENEVVLSVSDPKQFIAVIDSEYEKGTLTVDIQTNAPSGAMLEIFAKHPQMNEVLSTKIIVNRGIGQAKFEIDQNLETNFLTVYAVLNMKEQEDGKALKVTKSRYGQYGQYMKGESVFTEDGIYFNGVSEICVVPYPTTEEVVQMQKITFSSYMYYLCQTYPQIFHSISPNKETGEWDDITVVLSDYFILSSIDNLQEKINYLIELFESEPLRYYAVYENTQVRVTILDSNKNIITKNY